MKPDAFELILDSISDGVFTISPQWRITSWNRAAEQITGFSREEAVGTSCHDVFRANVCQGGCVLRQTMETGENLVNRPINILTREGYEKPVSISTALLRDEEGKVVGGVETFRDLTELEQLRKRLEKEYSLRVGIIRDIPSDAPLSQGPKPMRKPTQLVQATKVGILLCHGANLVNPRLSSIHNQRRIHMNRFIGLDGHSSSCTFAVLSEKGKTLRTDVVETNGQSLVEYLRLIPGRLHLCLEEGTQSQWLFELLAAHVHEIAVVSGEKNQGDKSDERDALGLAERMRTGALGAKIFKAPLAFTSVHDLARTYGMVTGDVVRAKNRIKSMYRSRGVQPGAGKAVYSTGRREEELKRLKGGTRQSVQLLCQELDILEGIKADAQQALVAEAHKHAIAKVLETAPGLGPVRVAQLLAIVVSPHRFRTSRQFWAYSGLAIVMRSSSDWVQQPNSQWMKAPVTRTRGLNRNFNRTAKAVFKGAATTVITQMPKNPLYSDYRRLLEEKVKPNLAKLTIARRIAAITLAMWKKKEAYDPAKYQKKAA